MVYAAAGEKQVNLFLVGSIDIRSLRGKLTQVRALGAACPVPFSREQIIALATLTTEDVERAEYYLGNQGTHTKAVLAEAKSGPAAHNAVGLAGESPVVGIDCLPT